MKILNKKFVYLISPNKITGEIFYDDLKKIFLTKKVSFFQLRLKKEKFNKKIIIARKILKLCRKYKVKLLINDDPYLTLKVNADGCHLGQSDMDIFKAKKLLGNKIIGITCHNSFRLAKVAKLKNATYIGLGAFFKSDTKKTPIKADIKTLNKIRIALNIPIVAIGGINEKNYKKLLLNNADFLAISGYIWNNIKDKPHKAILKLK